MKRTGTVTGLPVNTGSGEMLPGKLEDILRFLLDDGPKEVVEKGRYLRVLLKVRFLVCSDGILMRGTSSSHYRN